MQVPEEQVVRLLPKPMTQVKAILANTRSLISQIESREGLLLRCRGGVQRVSTGKPILVISEEPPSPLGVNKSFEDAAFGLGQVDENQAVYDSAELVVNVKSHYFSAELEIVFQENRHTFAIGLNIRNELRQLLHVFDIEAEWLARARNW